MSTTNTNSSQPKHLIQKQALISGLLGATSSCLAKLALDPNASIPSTMHQFCVHHSTTNFDETKHEEQFCMAISLGTRGVLLLIMVVMNVVMLSAFLDGMHESGSVAATALSTASNFAVSAIYGIMFFRESVTFEWMIGFIMILVGVYMLSTVNLERK